jgi:hypothetical protein
MKRCLWITNPPQCKQDVTGWAMHPIFGRVAACDEHRALANRALEENTVPVRPPCTCRGITDELTCPRHGERARLSRDPREAAES